MSALEHVDDGPRSESEPDRIVRWRIERLVAAGYDGETALLIAIDLAIDLHDAVDLVRAGCAPETALRILL
jgi:hypothetical protein